MTGSRGKRGDPEDFTVERVIDDVVIERGAHGLRITRPWSRTAGYAALGWVAIWCGLATFFATLGPGTPDSGALLLALPGLAMGYVAATRFLNRTVIEVAPSGIVLRHRPLPWPGGRRFDARDVAALDIETRDIHARGHTYQECRILVRRRSGTMTVLLKGLEMSGIAAAIGDCLGLPLTAARR